MHSKLSYVNVMATLAVFLGLGGSAVAAQHYVITSKSQVEPSVLKSLKGKAGKKGKTGAAGPAGPAGVKGAPGADGAAGPKGDAGTNGKDGTNGSNGASSTASTPLASGQTEAGTLAVAAGTNSPAVYGQISFAQPLAAALDSVHVVSTAAASTTHCPGVGRADVGYLCLYNAVLNNVTLFTIQAADLTQGIGRYGGLAYYSQTASNMPSQVIATWAVTAP